VRENRLAQQQEFGDSNSRTHILRDELLWAEKYVPVVTNDHDNMITTTQQSIQYRSIMVAIIIRIILTLINLSAKTLRILARIQLL